MLMLLLLLLLSSLLLLLLLSLFFFFFLSISLDLLDRNKTTQVSTFEERKRKKNSSIYADKFLSYRRSEEKNKLRQIFFSYLMSCYVSTDRNIQKFCSFFSAFYDNLILVQNTCNLLNGKRKRRRRNIYT